MKVIHLRSVILLSGLFAGLNSLSAQTPVERLLLDDPPAQVPVESAPATSTPALPTQPSAKPISTAPVIPETGETPAPLRMIASKMELVERRLTVGVNDGVRSLQDEIIGDLEQLLQCCSGSCSGGSKSSSGKQSDQNNQQPKPADNSKKPNSSAGKTGTSVDGEGTASGTNNAAGSSTPAAAARQVLEKTWGHLPERERARIFEALGDGFVPTYEEQTRQYFRRLAGEESVPAPTNPR